MVYQKFSTSAIIDCACGVATLEHFTEVISVMNYDLSTANGCSSALSSLNCLGSITVNRNNRFPDDLDCVFLGAEPLASNLRLLKLALQLQHNDFYVNSNHTDPLQKQQTTSDMVRAIPSYIANIMEQLRTGNAVMDRYSFEAKYELFWTPTPKRLQRATNCCIIT